jgi:ADP-ribose pyrophosphatase YjhB (NUDIX family)
VAEMWETWRSRLTELAIAGLDDSDDPFDLDRYQAVLELVAALSSGSTGKVTKEQARLPNHPLPITPKVDVRGVVYENDALLFVKERADGGWTFPGGWADVGISPAKNVEREIREESGYETRALRLLAVYDRQRHGHVPPHPHHIYKLFFQCELIGGTAATSVETADVAFFHQDKIPQLSRARVTMAQVERMFEMCRNPALPPDFD